MSLQQKFFLVVSMLSLALLGSLGAVWWAFGTLQRELTTPFSQTTRLLDTLREIKRLTVEQAEFFQLHGIQPTVAPVGEHASRTALGMRGQWAVPRPFRPGESQIAVYNMRHLKTIYLLVRIDSDEAMTARIGVSTWRNLRKRVDESASLAKAWFAGDTGSAQAQATAACFSIHELIERTEAQILTSAGSAVAHGDTVRTRLWKWLLSVFAAGLLGAILAVALLRRWVQKPVRSLREATARIARGDFQHRVTVRQRDELGQLSSEVNHMAEMVRVMQDERVERERLVAVGEMMRRVVHNVRNPLAGIRGLAEVTRLDLEKASAHRENMDLIVSTVDAFERWLSELLDATSPAAIHPCETPVPKWIAGIVEIHRSQAVARNVTVHLDAADAPPVATFDPKHMDHALSALVSNAIEATPAGGEVWVTARGTGDDGVYTGWEVGVVDRGGGVPPEILSQIFQPNFTTKSRGNGLGLAMARQIVKGHGGGITVVNGDATHPERCGAWFIIRLPLDPSKAIPNNSLSTR